MNRRRQQTYGGDWVRRFLRFCLGIAPADGRRTRRLAFGGGGYGFVVSQDREQARVEFLNGKPQPLAELLIPLARRDEGKLLVHNPETAQRNLGERSIHSPDCREFFSGLSAGRPVERVIEPCLG